MPKILLKFSFDSLLNERGFTPQRKKVLAIGGIAFILLLFTSFLMSLAEEPSEPTSTEVTTSSSATSQNASGSLQLPSSERFDFARGENPHLENLLNDAPAYSTNEGGVSGELDLSSGALGPAPIPTAEEENAALVNSSPSVSVPSTPVESTPSESVSVEPDEPAQSASVTINLYCDKFPDTASAETQKAKLAFQGIMATVTIRNGNYTLKVGPFATKDEAREMFQRLGDTGVIESCALVTN